jgi:hypothetical protein
MTELSSAVGKIITFVLFTVAMAAIQTGVFQDLWRWFITPFGVSQLSFFHAYGLLMFKNLLLLTVKGITEKEDSTIDILAKSAAITLATIMLWGLGYVAYLYK